MMKSFLKNTSFYVKIFTVFSLFQVSFQIASDCSIGKGEEKNQEIPDAGVIKCLNYSINLKDENYCEKVVRFQTKVVSLLAGEYFIIENGSRLIFTVGIPIPMNFLFHNVGSVAVCNSTRNLGENFKCSCLAGLFPTLEPHVPTEKPVSKPYLDKGVFVCLLPYEKVNITYNLTNDEAENLKNSIRIQIANFLQQKIGHTLKREISAQDVDVVLREETGSRGRNGFRMKLSVKHPESDSEPLFAEQNELFHIVNHQNISYEQTYLLIQECSSVQQVPIFEKVPENLLIPTLLIIIPLAISLIIWRLRVGKYWTKKSKKKPFNFAIQNFGFEDSDEEDVVYNKAHHSNQQRNKPFVSFVKVPSQPDAQVKNSSYESMSTIKCSNAISNHNPITKKVSFKTNVQQVNYIAKYSPVEILNVSESQQRTANTLAQIPSTDDSSNVSDCQSPDIWHDVFDDSLFSTKNEDSNSKL